MLAGGEVEAFTARRPDDHRVVMRFEEDARRAGGASSGSPGLVGHTAVLDVERGTPSRSPPGVSSIRSSPPPCSIARDRETEPDPATARAVAEALERRRRDARSAGGIPGPRSITRTMT